MKKPKLMRFRMLVGLFRGGKNRRRGVAIITVLAIISLMAVLIVSFFNMAQATRISAIGTVEMQKVVTLKDTVTNLVMAQIRQSTTLAGTDGQQVLWTSQPGAIRTYHGSNTSLTRLYKLYSAEKMMIDNIQADQSPALINEIEKDIEPKWDEYLDMYVDLNRPSVPSSALVEDGGTAKLKSRLVYPIADPRRYIGQKSAVTSNTEGFVYGERTLDTPLPSGVDGERSQLAMPVRWIYLLEDGTSGVVDREGKFRAIGKDGGSPSRDNPIVSRIAWWTDDESCKINVNVASMPVPWDTPRTNSAEDLWYAQYQPVNGECQHYPGHPSQTDLCAVFFPSYRYTPDSSIMPVGGEMNTLPPEWARLVWNITPYITEEGGTYGGTRPVNVMAAKPVELDLQDRMYSSAEEVYFKAEQLDENLNRPRETVSGKDQGGKLLERLQGASFFLTTRSNSPETTVFGTPKLCMYPLNEGVRLEVGKENGAVSPTVGSFEVTMATTCTLGFTPGIPGSGKPYYYQRNTNSGSRHNNFFVDMAGRDAKLFGYLKELTKSIPPGYPELPAAFNTFEKKYPGPNGTDGDKLNDKGAVNSLDSSDRSQILLSMLDFIRCSNMSPGYLESAQAYDNGNGQVPGICGCNKIDNPQDPNTTHAAVLNINPANHTTYSPRGAGRTYGPAEISFFANVTAIKKGNTSGGTLLPWANGSGDDTVWAQARSASQVQVGVLINAFSPRQGWAPLLAESGVRLGSIFNSGTSDAHTPEHTQAPMFFYDGNSDRQVWFGAAATMSGYSPASYRPATLIPWGGLVGPRVTGTQSVAAFAPMVYTGPGAGEMNTINVQMKWKAGEILRVFVYDGTVGTSNIVQIVDLASELPLEMVAEYGAKDFKDVIASSLQKPANSFPPPKTTLTSFVVPHGDYRLTSIPLRIERGIFVPHASYGHSQAEPALTGTTKAEYVLTNNAQMDPNGLLNAPGMRPIPVNNAPHFAPVNPQSLNNQSLSTKAQQPVLKVASADQIRALRFSHGRRDGQYQFRDEMRKQGAPAYARDWAAANKIPNRGSSDPMETGDFDNGVGVAPDGAYINSGDDGDSRDANRPYFASLTRTAQGNPASFSPNRVMRSPVEFGSLPTGIQARVPWQTLRFRPDPEMYKPAQKYTSLDHDPKKPDGYNHYFPFSNYCGPKDHLLLDMFWVPIVEPWAISEGFATKGLINLNQQIFPFTYIQRTTALHALLRSERMMAIPDSAAGDYKDGSKLGDSKVYRHWVNAKETIKQITDFRWKGQDPEGNDMPFNTFRSASEVCELWLVPDKNGSGNENGEWDLNYTIKEFWKTHRLTGDNMRERPYSNLYPRVTVRSNVFKIHMVAQTLKKTDSNAVDTFSTVPKDGADPDQVTAEWRGSAIVERTINPHEPGLRGDEMDYVVNYKSSNPTAMKRLDSFYSYRVTEVKSFGE
jgi:hypothetical protein